MINPSNSKSNYLIMLDDSLYYSIEHIEKLKNKYLAEERFASNFRINPDNFCFNCYKVLEECKCLFCGSKL